MVEKDIIPVETTEYRLGIIPARTPHDVITQATSIAKELAKIINDNHLSSKIQNRNFVHVEGWSTMGAMLGVLPREMPELTRRFDDGSYEATVELIRISDNAVIGRASALVGMDEKDRNGKLTWGNRAEYARRSMAVTRATGKAYRLGFSWIMALAGYEPTPAEEMQDVIDGEYKTATQPAQAASIETNQSTQTETKTNDHTQTIHPTFQRLIDEKLVENPYEAGKVASLLKLKLDQPDEAIRLVRIYRGWRDIGSEPKQAAEQTLAGKIPE